MSTTSAPAQKQSLWKIIQQHLMTGIGYMIPVIVGPGIMMGVVQIIGLITGIDVRSADSLEAGGATQMLAWMNQVAAPACRDLMYVVFAAYLAYSIANRTGLVTGFFGGLLSTASGAGFFGALITGFLAGYLMKWLPKKLKVSRTYLPVMNMVVYPFIGTAVIFLVCYLVINPLGTLIISSISSLVDSIGSLGGGLIAFVVAAGTSFDIGGPVSKGFLPVAFQLADAGFSKHPLTIGSVVPALGFGIAVIADKFIGKRLKLKAFDDDVEAAGIPGLILGLVGVSEGGLPLLLSDPIAMIVINSLGGGLASLLAYNMGLVMPRTAPPGIWGLPIVNAPAAFAISLLVGALFVAALTLLRRYTRAKKLQQQTGAEATSTES